MAGKAKSPREDPLERSSASKASPSMADSRAPRLSIFSMVGTLSDAGGAALPELLFRPLRITMRQVDVRFHRRCRNYSGVFQEPSHFRYVMQCSWGGATSQPRVPGACWWDALPQSYRLQRRWSEVVRFHEALAKEITFDPKYRCSIIKSRLPVLPERPDLDKFVCGVAARGEACIGNPMAKEGCDELELIHTVYVERQLKPYFAEVSRILQEVPVPVLINSLAFRRFVTSGNAYKFKDESALGHARDRFMGPRPLKIDEADLAAAHFHPTSPKSPGALQRSVSSPSNLRR